MRMGVAYSQEDFRLAVDVDLTKNEPLGYDPDKQYIGLGIEWNVKNNITLRTGFRNDLHAEEQLYSIGLGLETKSMYIDLAAARSKNNEELGVALQVGVIF